MCDRYSRFWIVFYYWLLLPYSTLTFSLQRTFRPSGLFASRRHDVILSAKRENGDANSHSSVIENIQFQLHSSISEIPSGKWDECLIGDECASPFMKHSWLSSLEKSKCVCKETGWLPQHLSLIINGKPWGGFVPLYLKSHSMGEFIFDSGWADAAAANGIDYYPKLLVAVPFTPATGRRILLHPALRKTLSKPALAAIRKSVALFLKQIAQNNGLSSVHLNFVSEEEASDIAIPIQKTQRDLDSKLKERVQDMMKEFRSSDFEQGYMHRTSLQYHWKNSNAMNQDKPYTDFEEYLSCFKSKRRISIRRERSRIQDDEGIRIDAIIGKEILEHDGLVERMFQIYLSTVDKMFWGRQYLRQDFFQLLTKSDFVDDLCFMCARRKSSGEKLKASDVIAGTFNIVRNGVFYGRYWGCMEEVKNLHFETCYWAAIEFCIKKGLKRMEPGAGGAEYKWARGFDPVLIHSIHYISHPGLRDAVSQYIEFETQNNIETTELLTQKSVIGSGLRRLDRKAP